MRLVEDLGAIPIQRIQLFMRQVDAFPCCAVWQVPLPALAPDMQRIVRLGQGTPLPPVAHEDGLRHIALAHRHKIGRARQVLARDPEAAHVSRVFLALRIHRVVLHQLALREARRMADYPQHVVGVHGQHLHAHAMAVDEHIGLADIADDGVTNGHDGPAQPLLEPVVPPAQATRSVPLCIARRYYIDVHQSSCFMASLMIRSIAPLFCNLATACSSVIQPVLRCIGC